RAGQTYMATTRDGRVLGTIAIDFQATPGLWTAEELATAVMVHRLIVSVDAAGQGVGAALLAHADRIAVQNGREWVRLDAWTTNAELHQLHVRFGFTHVRTVTGAATRSAAALFERRVGTTRPVAPSGPAPGHRYGESAGPDDAKGTPVERQWARLLVSTAAWAALPAFTVAAAVGIAATALTGWGALLAVAVHGLATLAHGLVAIAAARIAAPRF